MGPPPGIPSATQPRHALAPPGMPLPTCCMQQPCRTTKIQKLGCDAFYSPVCPHFQSACHSLSPVHHHMPALNSPSPYARIKSITICPHQQSITICPHQQSITIRPQQTLKHSTRCSNQAPASCPHCQSPPTRRRRCPWVTSPACALTR